MLERRERERARALSFLLRTLLTCFCRPSVMSTWDRMQVTHMLDGLGAMEVPQRQQRLFEWKKRERQEGC
jgi:hypothetical protein